MDVVLPAAPVLEPCGVVFGALAVSLFSGFAFGFGFIRTRFALAWARQHGRRTAAASEARWQRLSYDIEDTDAAGLLVKDGGGTRFAYGAEAAKFIDLSGDSPAIDIALAVAAEGREMHAIADVLQHLGRDSDEMLWSAMAELPRLLGEADRDGQVWTWAVRNRNQITSRAGTIRDERHTADAARAAEPELPYEEADS